MSILGNDLLLGSGDEGYNLTRSLRLRQSATAYLGRTFTSTGNRQIWTWSGWVKRGALSNGTLFGADGATYAFIYFNNDSLDCGEVVGSQQWRRLTTQVFRDPSAWYHIVLAFDSTQATAGNRVKLYVNGSQVTAFSTSADPSLNYNSVVNTTIAHSIGSFAAPTRQAYLDGYLTEVNFIDGQALTPSSFGSTNTLTGVWRPAQYVGTYGTNGFELQFTDNSGATATTIGKDFSGNGNNWTPNNISVTAGVTYDSMTDVPTLTSATAANFGVLNPIDNNNGTISRGNLYATIPTGTGSTAFGNFAMTSGKWYWEVIADSAAVFAPMIGVADQAAAATNRSWVSANGWYYYEGGQKYNNNTGTSYGASYVAGDVIGITYDADAGSLSFYKNNVSQGVAYNTGLLGKRIIPALGNGTSSNGQAYNCNFGQRPFAYTPPTGFVALNTYNLPTSTILKGNTVMDATLYNGVTGGATVTNAAGFKPDLVWMKSRNAARNHELVDSVRGTAYTLFSNLTNAEATDTRISSFNSNGFTYTANSNSANTGDTDVAWQWQAGQGTTSSNTSGTITSTVSVNASAGFSVVTWTGTGANATVGHGLGVAPSMVIVKNRSATSDWLVQNANLSSYAYALVLSGTNAQNTAANWWNSTAPTSSVFSVGNGSIAVNGSGNSMVAYCWTPIAGYSAFGSFVGNNSGDGPFVYLGFRPKYIMIKSSSNTTDWIVEDSARNPYNVSNSKLSPNTSGAEFTDTNAVGIDFLSNGFKVKGVDAAVNASGYTYIYACWAENPFRNALAR